MDHHGNSPSPIPSQDARRLRFTKLDAGDLSATLRLTRSEKTTPSAPKFRKARGPGAGPWDHPGGLLGGVWGGFLGEFGRILMGLWGKMGC